MRWAVVTLAAIGVVVVVAVAMASTGSKPAAKLRVLDDTPLTIRATGFKAHERVRLTVQSTGVAVRRVVAGSGGGFTLRMAGMSANSCTGFAVTATGDGGSRASLKRAPGRCALP